MHETKLNTKYWAGIKSGQFFNFLEGTSLSVLFKITADESFEVPNAKQIIAHFRNDW